MAIKCPNCDTDNSLDSMFCKKCAIPFSSTREVPVEHIETSQPTKEELITSTTLINEDFDKYIRGIINGMTVAYVGKKEVLWLNNEKPESLGICKLHDGTPGAEVGVTTKWKGELFLTKYRWVFSQKTLFRFLNPLMFSFWLKINLEGKTFHKNIGILKNKYVEYKGLKLSLELKGFLIKYIELAFFLVQMDNNIVKPHPNVLHPLHQIDWNLNKPNLFEIIKNARDSAPGISVFKVIDYLKTPEVNKNQFEYGGNELFWL